MSDVTYSRAGKEDRQEMIDFANLVFSQAREPHDFKALLPKTYADGVQGIEDWHYIAKPRAGSSGSSPAVLPRWSTGTGPWTAASSEPCPFTPITAGKGI